jgi:hypothetical protein
VLNLNKNYKFIIFGFFLFVLIYGILLFRDFGIFWDYSSNREYALQTWDYMFHDKPYSARFANEHARTHGPFIVVAFLGIEKLFQLNDSRIIYFMCSLLTFLVFYIGLIFFYFLAEKIFHKWWPALISCLILVVSPRIFSDAFYNSMDIPFLSMSIISFYTLLLLLEKKTIRSAILHAIASALLISTRNIGVFTAFITIVSVLFSANESRGKKFIILAVYFIPLALFIYVLWPYLWPSPIVNFFKSFLLSIQHTFKGSVLYWGQVLPARNLPWHYNFIWIGITLPILYSLLFVVGLFRIALHLIRGKQSVFESKYIILAFIFLAVPLVMPIVLKSALWNGWRHHYFIYPYFVLIAVYGLELLTNVIKKPFLLFMLIGVLVFSFAETAINMVGLHPYGAYYFNSLAGNNIRNKFDLDIWGISYRAGLEYILTHDQREKISISIATGPGAYYLTVLRKEDRDRFILIPIKQFPDYVLTIHRHLELMEREYPNEVFFVKAGNEKIMSVFKLK